MKKLLLEVLSGKAITPAPLWIMRQAGRYLPEYRKVRNEFKNFIAFCADASACAEVTLQPITRFDMDAAIIFSDILLIPHALGCEVKFVENEGPLLNINAPLQEMDIGILDPVYQAIRLVKNKLDKDRSLIGFVGCPWTLACYMKEGKSSKDYQQARIWMQQYPQQATILLETLTEAIATHAIQQIEAGCDVIQLFDSWAGAASAKEWQEIILPYTSKVVKKIRQKYPQTPLIGFPKGAGRWLAEYQQQIEVQAISLDSSRSIAVTVEKLKGSITLQGNLDPIMLFASRDILQQQLQEIKMGMQGRPHIFNLGHGILPQTNPDQVAWLIETWRKG